MADIELPELPGPSIVSDRHAGRTLVRDETNQLVRCAVVEWRAERKEAFIVYYDENHVRHSRTLHNVAIYAVLDDRDIEGPAFARQPQGDLVAIVSDGYAAPRLVYVHDGSEVEGARPQKWMCWPDWDSRARAKVSRPMLFAFKPEPATVLSI